MTPTLEAQVATIDQRLEDHIIDSQNKYWTFENTTKNVDEMVIHLKWIKWLGFGILGLSTPNLLQILKFFFIKTT
mgnify:CR=1 FL=1